MRDNELGQEVLDELKFDPSLNAENVRVAVSDRVATLSGYVNSYGEKIAADRAARRVSGVSAVDVDIAIKLPEDAAVDDDEIARLAIELLGGFRKKSETRSGRCLS